MDEEELVCTKYKELVNAHLPIPELNRKMMIKMMMMMIKMMTE